MLFQRKVVAKYLSKIDSDLLNEKYNLFCSIFSNKEKQENIKNTREEQYQEGFIRDLFCSVLGYTIKPEPNYNILTELKNEVKNKSNSKKSDGAVVLNGQTKAVIELKGTDTQDLDKVAFQAFSYKNFHSNCHYVIVSNFERLRFYVEVQSDYQEFDIFNLDKENFNLLYLLLSLEQIENDIPLKLKTETLSEEKAITDNFYSDYSTFKRNLFEDLVENNPDIDKLVLFKKTQKLLDRILFVLFCEDRSLLPANSILGVINSYDTLKEMGFPKPLYDCYKNFFERIDKGFANDKDHTKDVFAYNGGLFKTDEILDNIKVGDDVLFIYGKKLADYDFESQISVDILGRIFENSLTEIEEVQKEIEDEKNGIKSGKGNIGKRKKDGVFYTPAYITKYIVDNTIGKLCEKKRNELNINDETFTVRKRQNTTITELDKLLDEYRDWLLNLKILDCACGSGAFLIAALYELIKQHELIDKYYNNIHRTKSGQNALNFTHIENSILENNLYGVDINDDSIEIAKLSLWLNTARKNRKLTALNDKIKCGNSLIDDETVAGEKAFVWEKEFAEVFEKGGFDVVIGNPPYVSAPMQLAAKNLAIQREAIAKSGEYKTLYQKWDLYIPFMEKGLRLLSKGGRFAMIVPYPLSNQLYGKIFREWVLKNYDVCEITDLNGAKIFDDATVSNLILFANAAEPKGEIKISHIKETKEIAVDFVKNKTDLIQDEKTMVWNLTQEKRETNRHASMYVLGDFCYISIGMVLNADEKSEKGAFTKDELISLIKDEIHCKKYIEGKDLEKYKVKRIRYLEYDTERVPNRLRRPTFPELYDRSKLLINALGDLKVAIDDNDNYYCEQQVRMAMPWHLLKGVENNSISNSVKKFSKMTRQEMEELSKSVNLKYLLAIMNSKYASVLLTNIRSGDYHIVPEHIRNIPIPQATQEQQKPFIELAEKMLSLNENLQKKTTRFTDRIKETYSLKTITSNIEQFYNATFADLVKELAKQKIKLSMKQKDELEDYYNEYANEIKALQEEIEKTDNEINNMVYSLYGLTEEEIKTI